jgi:hypothetical protein
VKGEEDRIQTLRREREGKEKNRRKGWREDNEAYDWII